MKQLAPIVLFVYNRPDHTLQTLEALSRNELADESKLYIYSDAPKEGASDEDRALVGKVRKLLRSKAWCKEVFIKEATANKGLASSVIEGVTEIVNKYGKVIVLEDDIVTSPFFLRYLNDGLDIYRESPNVYAVNAYIFPMSVAEVTTFLSPLGTSTWGWATWASKWRAFDVDPKYKQVIQQNKFLRDRFNLADYNYAGMLDNKNSWGIRWYYSVFVRNGLGVFPTRPLCYNIGFDEKATHTKTEIQQMEIYEKPIEVRLHEHIDLNVQGALLDYFTKKALRKSRSERVLSWVKRLLK